MKKKKQTEQMDERQLQINAKALCWGGGFLALCVIISMIWKLISTESLGWEFFALGGASLVIAISSNLMGNIEQPRNLFMKPLPTSSTKEDRKIRKLSYSLEGLTFASVCTVGEILFFIFAEKEGSDLSLVETIFPGFPPVLGVIISAVISFGITFGLSWVVDYLIGEKFIVARYNKMLSELDSDEDE